ncbi:tight adherence protein B [Compostimonas suwonensis]|uniref:Tight adherence protein B n=1 Tax=Compostimonas suwonensis TaxID=1048394 RepID=A0A2M9BBX3_9MICO|nr:tight adherence protein B [Compostimonas suwonensis]
MVGRGMEGRGAVGQGAAVRSHGVRRRARDRPPPIETVAAVTERLAVLLSAGVAPASAWGYLSSDTSIEQDAAAPVIGAAASAGSTGADVARALAASVDARQPLGQAWLGLASAWAVATESGAPLATCLRHLAESFRQLGATQRDLSVAMAGPASTARLVMAMPVIGVLFGLGLGFDTVHTLFGTIPGAACLVVGILLMLLAGRWNRALIAAAQPRRAAPGLSLDLMAIAMTGGASLDRARALVDRVVVDFALPVDDERSAVDGVLELSRRAGVPAGELLRSEAEQLRRSARSEGQRSAAALAVKLMLPLGVCVLPAFMLLGVAPLLFSVISSTVSVIV